MALNREQKRMLKKQGELAEDGSPQAKRAPRPAAKAPTPAGPKETRLFSRQGMREVRAELRKVAWPTRSETINYSIIVAMTLVVMTTLIFCLDWVFSETVLRLFNVK